MELGNKSAISPQISQPMGNIRKVVEMATFIQQLDFLKDVEGGLEQKANDTITLVQVNVVSAESSDTSGSMEKSKGETLLLFWWGNSIPIE